MLLTQLSPKAWPSHLHHASLVSVCFVCSSRMRPYAGLSFAGSVWSLFCLPWAELTDFSDWCIGGIGVSVSYCFLHQCSVASVDRLVCPLYVDAHVLGRLYTVIFGRPNHRDNHRDNHRERKLSLCETGSSMAMVKVLRPNITCDKIPSVSEGQKEDNLMEVEVRSPFMLVFCFFSVFFLHNICLLVAT